MAYASPRLSTGAIKVVNSKEAAVRVPSKVVGGEVHSQLRALDAGRSCVARIARAAIASSQSRRVFVRPAVCVYLGIPSKQT